MTDDRRALASTAAALAASVARLRETIDELLARAERSERAITITRLMLAVVVVLIVIVGGILRAQFVTNARLEQANAREAQTRQEVLCPMFGLFLGSYAPQSRAAGHDRDKYEQAFGQVRDLYIKLECTNPVVPPRSDTPR